MQSTADRARAYVSRASRLREDIESMLEFLCWRNRIKSDSVVFVKPNFTYPIYTPGITTSPLFLGELLKILKNRCRQVTVCESDGGNHSFSAKEAFEGHGMTQVCNDAGASLVNLSDFPRSSVSGRIGGRQIWVELPDILLEEAESIISVPVLKVHVMTGVSLGMKNLWGCYPDTMRCLHHKHLDNKLVLLTKMLNPVLTLIDATHALNYHGPMYGQMQPTNLVVGGDNPVTTDALGAALMGIPLDTATHVLLAAEEGLGSRNPSEAYMNEDWTKYRQRFEINRTLIDIASTLLFNSNSIAKVVMDSPLTPAIYRIAGYLRTPEEARLSRELGGGRGNSRKDG